ncbi:MAG: hypothetical protein AAF555_00180 [Verrucomicrobiota bacterium]
MTDAPSQEKVLVVPRSLFEALGSFQGIHTDPEKYLPSFLDPKNNFFLERAAAEEDPNYKQIIPYALFHHRGRFLHYVRGQAGGEKRLAAKGSLGIGGHINTDDYQEEHLGPATYLHGVAREVKEEIRFQGEIQQRVVALLNDDSNSVGQVHLGVVHLFDLLADSPQVEPNEAPITDLEFLSLSELEGRSERLESWSAFCVPALPSFMEAT